MRITGKVIAIDSNICIILTTTQSQNEKIIEVFDNNKTANVGDFISARSLPIAEKNVRFTISEILHRRKDIK